MPHSGEEVRIVSHVVDIYRALLRVWSTKRQATERTFKFLKGGDDSWDADILEALNEAKMPHLNLNIMLPIMMRIYGAEQQRRGKLKAVPLNDESVQTAQTWTGIFDAIESHYKTGEQFGQAFKQSITGDLPSAVRLKWSFTKDPLGMPEPEFLNCFYLLLGECSKKDLSDCREVVISWFITKEEVIDAFPEQAEEINKYYKEDKKTSVVQRMRDSVAQLFGSSKHIASEQMYDRSGNIRVIELYERNTKTEMFMVRSQDPTNTEDDLKKIPEDRIDEFKRDQPGATFIKRNRDIMTVTTVLGDQILLQEKTPLPIQNNKFPFFVVWGFNVDGENQGLGRQLEGPLEEYQKSRSAELQIIGTAANSGWQIERGSLLPDEERKVETAGGGMGLILTHEQGRSAPVKIQPATPPLAMQNRSIQAKQDLQFISAVSDNTLARSETSNESGKLFDSRVEQFVATLSEYFNNLRNAQEWCGDYMIDMVRFYVGESEREFTNSESGETFTVNEQISPLLPNIRIRDLTKGRLAAKSEVAPTTLTARREIANILIQTLQYTQSEQLQPVILKLIFEKLELPDEERQELVEAAQRLISPSAIDQLEAAAQVEDFAGQSGEPVAPVQP